MRKSPGSRQVYSGSPREDNSMELGARRARHFVGRSVELARIRQVIDGI
jgi:hypothetical protein